MMPSARSVFFVLFFACVTGLQSQNGLAEVLKPDPDREKMFFPYLAVHHGGPEATLKWKESNTVLYYKELWYYCRSFSVHRDYFPEGGELQESIIDISRFEHERKVSESAVVVLPGLKDVIVLLPEGQLIYKPDYVTR